MPAAVNTAGDRRADNPTKYIQRYPSKPREVFLLDHQFDALETAIDEFEAAQRRFHPAPTIIRELMLTGARRGEIETLRRSEMDLRNSMLRLHDSKTGPKNIMLSPAAVQLFERVPINMASPYVFPGRDPSKPTGALNGAWFKIRAAAGLEHVRLHDLRHSYVSLAVRNHVDLEAIGGQLGHRSRQTTDKYKHLVDDYVREGNDKVGQALERLAHARREKRSAG